MSKHAFNRAYKLIQSLEGTRGIMGYLTCPRVDTGDFIMNNTITTVYLDEQFRNPGVDHLDQYRDSCFYNLLRKSVKERGSAYEEIAAKVFSTFTGKEAKVAPSSHGSYDLVLDGKKYELKGSRKASQYDSRKRTYQFSQIKDNGMDILLMVIQPNDIVLLYKTTFDRLKNEPMQSMHKAKDGDTVAWNLNGHPEYMDTDLIAAVKMK